MAAEPEISRERGTVGAPPRAQRPRRGLPVVYDPAPHDLEDVLEVIEERARSASGHKVTVGHLMEAFGRRSFGPILVVVGVIVVSPVGGIPGLPTLSGALVMLVALQLLVGRHHFVLPRFLLERSMEQDKLIKSVEFCQRPARWVDSVLKNRLAAFVSREARFIMAISCVGLSMVMPLLEFVPFSSGLAGLVLTCYGLALIAEDGLFAVLGFLLFGGIAAVLLTSLF